MSTPESASLLQQAKRCLQATDAPVEQWKQLCGFLCGLKAKEQASILRGLDTALNSFPPAVRTVWPEWLARLRQGQRVPAMQLARALSWTGPNLDLPALRELLAHPDFPHLQRLKLFGQDLSTPAIHILIQAPRLRRLQSLNLTSNRVDGEGLLALIATTAPLQLTELYLGRNQIDDTQAKCLLNTPISASLTLLCLRDNPISQSLRDELQAHFHGSPLTLRLACAPAKASLPKRKRGRPSKKRPPKT